MRTQLELITQQLGTSRTIVRLSQYLHYRWYIKHSSWEEKAPGKWRNTGGRPREDSITSRFRPGSQPRLEQLFCPVPMPTLPLVSMRTFSRTSCCFPARSRTIIRFPRPDPEQAPFVIGEEQPQTRRNPTPRPRKSPTQAPNPNKSTPIRPRAGPEHRLLPPHGVCGTILPYPAYLELYLVPHVR